MGGHRIVSAESRRDPGPSAGAGVHAGQRSPIASKRNWTTSPPGCNKRRLRGIECSVYSGAADRRDELDKQLDEIDAEVGRVRKRDRYAFAIIVGRAIAPLSFGPLKNSARQRSGPGSTGPISPELKRRIVEALVEKVEANTVERWGVQQSEIMITYRFGQPNEPAALVLPRSHESRTGTAAGATEHNRRSLLRRRLILKLLQTEVAEQIGVDKSSIGNWESNRTTARLEYMPAIIRFLGYNPLPPADKWSERLVQCRTVLGLSQKGSAKRIGVDPCTLARWERGEREPGGAFATAASRFVSSVEVRSSASAIA